MSTTKFYSLNNILEYNADYNVIYGERSNGKTTAVLAEGLKHHILHDYKKAIAIIRRNEEDFKGAKAQQITENLVNLGWVKEWSLGEYNSIYYQARKWYLALFEDGKKVKVCPTPFAYGFTIVAEEHYKMTAYPDIDIILFDEFISRSSYLTDEFIKFQNLLSTIIRLRSDVKIFMCGNTINKYCPYFNEMGLRGVKKQKQGTIDIYTYGESGLTVAVEYSDFPSKKKASNKYFAFDNPKLKMITQGGWEIDIYPHLPTKYKPQDVQYKFYICFDNEWLQGNIISVDDTMFLYIHRKTTPLREDNEKLVYHQQPNYKRNFRTNILRPYGKVDKYIKDLIVRKKVFYQDNDVGELMNNYLDWCIYEK